MSHAIDPWLPGDREGAPAHHPGRANRRAMAMASDAAVAVVLLARGPASRAPAPGDPWRERVVRLRGPS